MHIYELCVYIYTHRERVRVHTQFSHYICLYMYIGIYRNGGGDERERPCCSNTQTIVSLYTRTHTHVCIMYAYILVWGRETCSLTRTLFSLFDLSIYTHTCARVHTHIERACDISHTDTHYPLNIQNCIYTPILSCSRTNTYTVFSLAIYIHI